MIGHACNARGAVTQWTSSSSGRAVYVAECECDWSHSVATLGGGGGRGEQSGGVTRLDFSFCLHWHSTSNTEKWRITARTKPRRIWTLRRTRASCGISFRGKHREPWRFSLSVVAALRAAVATAAVRGGEGRGRRRVEFVGWSNIDESFFPSFELSCFWLASCTFNWLFPRLSLSFPGVSLNARN